MSVQRKRKSRRPDTTLLIMWTLAIGAVAVMFTREGVNGVQRGFGVTLETILDVGPEVLLGIGLAGMLQVLVPPGLVTKWMGEGSGMTGIAVGTVAGIITPGGPYILFPVAASLATSGAGVGPLSAFVAMRNTATVNRLAVWEIPLLGIPFSVARILCSIPMAAAQIVFTPVVFRIMPERTRKRLRHSFSEPPTPPGRGTPQPMVVAVMAGTLMTMAFFVARRDGIDGLRNGLNQSWLTLRGVVLPMLLGLTMAGMTQEVLPAPLVRQLMGDESGISGVAIGVLIGMLTPVGPYVVMPLAASLLGTGAGVGPIAAFVTAWSVTPVARTLVWELPFMGAAFTASRVLVSLPFPFFVGFAMPWVYALVR